MSNFKKLNWIIAVGILIAIGAGVGIYFLRSTTAAAAQTADTVEAFVGDLDATATASGQLVPQTQAALSLAQSGEVAEIYVAIGDEVAAGDVLLVLDTGDLVRAVRDAEQSVLIQQNRLNDLLRPATDVERAAANASVANAEARLAELRAGSTAETVAAQEAAVQAARADVASASARLSSAQSGGTSDELLAAGYALTQAQEQYTAAEEAHRATYDCTWNDGTASFDCLGGSDAEKAARVTAQQALANLRAAEERVANLQPGANATSVAAAQASLTNAQASLLAEEARLTQLLDGGSAADMAAAEAALANAQKQLDSLQTGPSDFQITQQEVQVEHARIALERAQNDLTNATLVAPFDGFITAVNVEIGESAAGPIVELVQGTDLDVVLEVDEIDLGSLHPGQSALVTFESYPNRPLQATVDRIAPENIPNAAGTVVYEVNLTLEETDLFLLEGMTADAVLTVEQRQNILLVPNEAIQSDRSSGTYAVDVVTGRSADGSLIVATTPVTIGLRDSRYTQITSNLDPGTELAVEYNPPPRFEFGPPARN